MSNAIEKRHIDEINNHFEHNGIDIRELEFKQVKNADSKAIKMRALGISVLKLDDTDIYVMVKDGKMLIVSDEQIIVDADILHFRLYCDPITDEYIIPSLHQFATKITFGPVVKFINFDKPYFNGNNTIEEVIFNDIDFGDTKKFTGMFLECRSLKKVEFNNCKAYKATDFNSMFYWCTALKEAVLDIDANCNDISFMFIYCRSIESVNLHHIFKHNSRPQFKAFEVSATKTFEDCDSLKRILLPSSKGRHDYIYSGFKRPATDNKVEVVYYPIK